MRQGPQDSNIHSISGVGGTAFFAANDGVHGYEVWKSDGTTAGTQLVLDINPGTADGVPSSSNSFLDLNGTALFAANDGIHGRELWKSDGTAAGTQLVLDIKPDGDGLEYFTYWSRGVLNGRVFFSGINTGYNRELWKSDGTAAGTEMIEIRPGAAGGEPLYMTAVNGTLYMKARADGPNDEFWKSDGTADGTVLVADLRPGSWGSDPREISSVEGLVVFGADNGAVGRELWTYDPLG